MRVTTLRKMCKTYQALLRLKDWKITVKFTDDPKEIDDDHNGETLFTAEECTAEIFIRRREDLLVEQTLLHELLHVRFHTVHREDDAAFEFAIDATATALLTLAAKL